MFWVGTKALEGNASSTVSGSDAAAAASALLAAKPSSAVTHEMAKPKSSSTPVAAGKNRGAGHDQRPKPLDEPGVEILCHADGGGLGTEHHGLHEDPGHEVIDVADARDVDRAAEYVAEQKHEDHRLDGREGEHLGPAGHPDDVASGDRQGVGGRPRQLRSP